jgi:hypothetical protein
VSPDDHTREPGRLWVPEEMARDLLNNFTDDQLRQMGQDPDELRRMVEKALPVWPPTCQGSVDGLMYDARPE